MPVQPKQQVGMMQTESAMESQSTYAHFFDDLSVFIPCFFPVGRVVSFHASSAIPRRGSQFFISTAKEGSWDIIGDIWSNGGRWLVFRWFLLKIFRTDLAWLGVGLARLRGRELLRKVIATMIELRNDEDIETCFYWWPFCDPCVYDMHVLWVMTHITQLNMEKTVKDEW